MKERPIPFSAEMVRAILDGRKTQTRRVIKPNTIQWQPGDIAWVRETWRVISWPEGDEMRIETRDGKSHCTEIGEVPPDREDAFEDWIERISLQCGDDCERGGMILDESTDAYRWADGLWRTPPTRWRSPRFMPRWASRILLAVIEVREEWLQEISEKDAKAEGVESRKALAHLWDKIYAESGYPWKGNPLVRVITFKVLKPERIE